MKLVKNKVDSDATSNVASRQNITRSLYADSRSNDAHAFKPLLVEIEEEPASPLGHLIFWVVLAVFVFFILWSVLGQVDVVVSARGKVVPVGEIKTIQPLT